MLARPENRSFTLYVSEIFSGNRQPRHHRSAAGSLAPSTVTIPGIDYFAVNMVAKIFTQTTAI
jgi:hypothetical protein